MEHFQEMREISPDDSVGTSGYLAMSPDLKDNHEQVL
jgi:hypothetical protein